ncbi:PadR family transcriptional regulator [Fusibacter ferrireducens]|uniref:PadR family transcriptional regulator n=1 Tax=Fusibacter ferrireducens TaxID=2785058 RepID=A0ABR9ZUM6_9FIRM|nr:PadR family transcriptional regulator [Fusibacter ferrireducens]MBF4694169.1 PadR family transcriptional regulator [Fusibacter ferrireducens]
MKGKPGRHAPAFVLLELSKGPNYGLQILNQLKENLAVCKLDSAAIYRALNSLEASGYVRSYTEDTEHGVAKRFYAITDEGHNALRQFKEDIQMRIKNLEYFLSTYEKMEVNP